MRRRAGLGAIQRSRQHQEVFREKGSRLQENQLDEMVKQMAAFRSNLEQYAAKHRKEIVSNPAFRRQFQDMCASIGVDPLASGRGFWSEVLGVGDLYYELGVQVVELCLASQRLTGGMLPLEECVSRLNARRAKQGCPVSRDSNGRLTAEEAAQSLGWPHDRAARALTQMAAAGLAWRDDVDASYWLPALFRQPMA